MQESDVTKQSSHSDETNSCESWWKWKQWLVIFTNVEIKKHLKLKNNRSTARVCGWTTKCSDLQWVRTDVIIKSSALNSYEYIRESVSFRYNVSFTIFNQLFVFTCSFEELLWWMNAWLLMFHACMMSIYRSLWRTPLACRTNWRLSKAFLKENGGGLSESSRRRRGTRLVNVQSWRQTRLLGFHTSMKSQQKKIRAHPHRILLFCGQINLTRSNLKGYSAKKSIWKE